MAKLMSIQFTKTYASPANAEAAVAKVLGSEHTNDLTVTYTIVPVETDRGLRYGVLFLGHEAAHRGIHFHFNVVAV